MTFNTTPIETTLNNGLKIIIRELPQATGVTCLINYNVSRRDESVENAGINMAFINTMNIDNYDNKLDRPRAMNYVNHTTLNFSLKPDQLNQCFELNARMMTVPVLTESTLKRLIESDLKYRANKRHFMSDDWIPVEFDSKCHPIGYAYTPMATPESAARIDITQMRQWHQRYYSPGNACLIVVGNVKADEVTHLAKQHFDVIPSRPKPPVRALPQPCELDRRHVLYKATSKPGLLLVPYMAGMSDALADQSGGALSILSMLLDQKLSTLPSVSHGICRYEQDKYASLFRISVTASTRDQSLEDLEADIETLWHEIKFNPLPADELQMARQRALATLVRSDNHARNHEALALDMGQLENYQIPFSALNQRQRDLLDVTAQDIQRIARTCFSPQRTTVVHILPLQTPSLTTTADLILSNGLKVITLENPRSTKVVCAMHYRVSKRDESADNSGITELVGRMLAKNKHFMGEQKFQFWNCEDFILCVITVDPDQLNNAFKSLAAIMDAPTLTVEAMGQVIEAGLAQREQSLSFISDYSVPKVFQALAFPTSGYGNLSITPDSAAQIDLKQVQDWHRNYYCASNACLVIVGNVKAAVVEQWVHQHFGALPLRPTTSAPKTQELREPGLRRTTLRMNTKVPRLLVAFNVSGLIEGATDHSAATLQIFSALFELNYKKLLPVARGVCVFSQEKHAGLFRISLTANHADQSLEELETELLQLIETYKLNGAPAGELEITREQAIAEMMKRETDDETVAFDLFRLEDSQLPLTLLDQRYDRLLEVTNEDIQRAANTYFTPERMTVAHILPMQAPMQ
ncbi:hypothetical protein PS850_04536 [Pseudomonas fluorescens]|nr:hypothetical protein PS850_04536 [Pseudomonas fluorescens]